MSEEHLSTKTESAGKQCEDQAERDRRGCKGKRIVMVDDSIVRGTTCANIIKMLKKKAGAKRYM